MVDQLETSGDLTREVIIDALESQRQPTKTVLSCLLAISDALHYLPDEAIKATAHFCGVTLNEVWNVADFYTNFRFTPPGRNLLEVCWGPACHVMGAQVILQMVQSTLNLDGEGETAEGGVTLKYNTCLGACAHAPVISVNHSLIGRVTPESASETASTLL